jgi:hypothetical protein
MRQRQPWSLSRLPLRPHGPASLLSALYLYSPPLASLRSRLSLFLLISTTQERGTHAPSTLYFCTLHRCEHNDKTTQGPPSFLPSPKVPLRLRLLPLSQPLAQPSRVSTLQWCSTDVSYYVMMASSLLRESETSASQMFRSCMTSVDDDLAGGFGGRALRCCPRSQVAGALVCYLNFCLASDESSFHELYNK